MPDSLVSYGQGLTILAERDADRLAVAHEGHEVTRGELDRQSNRLARAYAQRGVSQGDFVTLALPNSVEFVVATFAIWKLGAIVVPCNPMLRERELADQLRDCEAVGLVALESLYHETVAAALPGTELRFVVTTSELDLLEQEPPDAAQFRDVPNLLASPHIAFYSESAIRESQTKAATQVINVLTGKAPPDYQVN